MLKLLVLLIIIISLAGCAITMKEGDMCFRFNPDIAEPEEELDES